MQNFTFNEIVEFLQSGNNKTKEQAEKEFADWLAKNGKFNLVPQNVAQRLFDESAIEESKELLIKANFEVLVETNTFTGFIDSEGNKIYDEDYIANYQANINFVYHDGDEWVISNFHSSALPLKNIARFSLRIANEKERPDLDLHLNDNTLPKDLQFIIEKIERI